MASIKNFTSSEEKSWVENRSSSSGSVGVDGVVGSTNTTVTSNNLANTATVSTHISRGLPFRPSAGGLVFTGRFGKQRSSTTAAIPEMFKPTSLASTIGSTTAGAEWWGAEYVPDMSNSILPPRKLGDESDVDAILKKCSAGYRTLGVAKSRPDTIVSLCGLDTDLMEELWKHFGCLAPPGTEGSSPTACEFKYRDLRVLRIQTAADKDATTSSSWSIMKPLAAANTVKPYVVDSALFISDIAILPIDITEIKTLGELRRLLAAPSGVEITRAESSSDYKKAKRFSSAPASSLYNMLVRLQVNGGGASTGAGGLLDTTIVALIDRPTAPVAGADLTAASRIATFKNEIAKTVLEIRTKFCSATKEGCSMADKMIVSGDSVDAAVIQILDEMKEMRRCLEFTRSKLAASLDLNLGLKMQIICVYVLKEKQELILCTRVLSGSVAVGESVEIGPFPGVKDKDYESSGLSRDTGCWRSNDMSFSVTETVLGIKHYDKFVTTAFAGQLVGLRMSLKNFDQNGKLNIPLSWQTQNISSSRTYSLHTGLMMTSVKWRSQSDVPVDVAVPAIETFEIDPVDFNATTAELVPGRPYTVTCGSYEGRVKLASIAPSSGNLSFYSEKDSPLFVLGRSISTTGGSKDNVGTLELDKTPATLGRVTISAGSLILGSAAVAKATYRCRKLHNVDLTSVTMILRRLFPFELTVTLLEYAHPDAMKVFTSSSSLAAKPTLLANASKK